jgi:hypothetical protein
VLLVTPAADRSAPPIPRGCLRRPLPSKRIALREADRRRPATLTSVESITEPRFKAPRPGTRMIDAVHPRPVTRYWEEMHPEPFDRGFSEFPRYAGC